MVAINQIDRQLWRSSIMADYVPFTGEHVFRATEFSKPLAQFVFGRRYKLPYDYARSYRRDLGTLVHRALLLPLSNGYGGEELLKALGASPDGIIDVEQRLWRPIDVDGVRALITGQPDIVVRDKERVIIIDVKTVSIYGMTDFTQYQRQLSIYRWLLNVDAEALVIKYAVDYKAANAAASEPSCVGSVDLLPLDECEDIVAAYLHALFELEDNKELPSTLYCSEDERLEWGVDKRTGAPKRCALYCDYRELCPYGRDLTVIT